RCLPFRLLQESFVGGLFMGVVLGLAGCGSGGDTESDLDNASPELTGAAAYVPWRLERARRDAGLDVYLLSHHADFSAFKNAPLGNSGVPMIMMRLFPEMFPDIWGGPDAPFSKVGFAPDTFEPWRPLPLGLGYVGAE